jgi:hypothetical protein
MDDVGALKHLRNEYFYFAYGIVKHSVLPVNILFLTEFRMS